jgi:hypothetical protein
MEHEEVRKHLIFIYKMNQFLFKIFVWTVRSSHRSGTARSSWACSGTGTTNNGAHRSPTVPHTKKCTWARLPARRRQPGRTISRLAGFEAPTLTAVGLQLRGVSPSRFTALLPLRRLDHGTARRTQLPDTVGRGYIPAAREAAERRAAAQNLPPHRRAMEEGRVRASGLLGGGHGP